MLLLCYRNEMGWPVAELHTFESWPLCLWGMCLYQLTKPESLEMVELGWKRIPTSIGMHSGSQILCHINQQMEAIMKQSIIWLWIRMQRQYCIQPCMETTIICIEKCLYDVKLPHMGTPLVVNETGNIFLFLKNFEWTRTSVPFVHTREHWLPIEWKYWHSLNALAVLLEGHGSWISCKSKNTSIWRKILVVFFVSVLAKPVVTFISVLVGVTTVLDRWPTLVVCSTM